MGKGTFWRIPEKPLITAVFFDVDGTLTDAQGKVPENYANVLHYMAQSVLLAPEGKLKLYIYGVLLSFCRLPYVQL